MPNTSPQAIFVSNSKLRPTADKFGQLYNLCKALQAEAQAEGWASLFPNDAEVIADGADVDGRTVISNADLFTLIGIITSFLSYMEASSNANRNNVLKIAVNPEGR
jgi:hypothetical protein